MVCSFIRTHAPWPAQGAGRVPGIRGRARRMLRALGAGRPHWCGPARRQPRWRDPRRHDADRRASRPVHYMASGIRYATTPPAGDHRG
jgi:hypothetical protein